MSYYPAIQTSKGLAATFAKEIPKYLTADEVNRVLEGVRKSPRDHLLINMLWQTGARVSELLQVRVSDIDFYTKTMRLPTLKRRDNATKRTIPINDSLKGDIGAYIAMKALSKGESLFTITRQTAYFIVRDAVTGAGIEKERAHPHTFRHSFAVHCRFRGSLLALWADRAKRKSATAPRPCEYQQHPHLPAGAWQGYAAFLRRVKVLEN